MENHERDLRENRASGLLMAALQATASAKTYYPTGNHRHDALQKACDIITRVMNAIDAEQLDRGEE